MGFFLMIGIAILVASGYFSISLYKSMKPIFPNVKLRVYFTAVFSVAALLIFSFLGASLPISASFRHFLDGVFGYGASIYLCLLFFTAVADAVTLAVCIFKRSFIARKLYRAVCLCCVLAFSCITLVYGFCNARQIDCAEYEIEITDKATLSDFSIVMLSDLLLDIVEEINALQPDIVCIAGDFFDNGYDGLRNPAQAAETLKKISATYGVYACLGNHDAGETVEKMQSFIQNAGIRLLNDEYVIIDERLVLVGRLDGRPHGNYGEMRRKPLSEFLDVADERLPVVVLDHNPKHIDEYEPQADLVLSGHTHKGQVFPGSIVTWLTYSVDYGYYRAENGTQAVVSSGVGYWRLPLRIGTDSEIVKITFR